jgi:hypothetical protein
MKDLKDQIIEKQDELIESIKCSHPDWDEIEKIETELATLKSQLKEQQCNKIIEKVKESWSPDKRSFEEAEAESRLKAKEDINKVVFGPGDDNYGRNKPFWKDTTQDGAEGILKPYLVENANFKMIVSKEDALKAMHDFARQSLKKELKKFVKYADKSPHLLLEDVLVEYLKDN